MAAGRDSLIGSVLDERYALERVLGEGAMGSVYVARQRSTGLTRAIKVVRVERKGDARQVERFEREAELIKQLRDPHTVQLIDQGRMPDGRLYLVYELLEGETLGARIAQGPLSVDDTLDVMTSVCHSLAEAHGRGIVHRDLKPENLFISVLGHREVLKVLDFGVAHWVGSTTTTAGTVIGTAAYMAPEQALGERVDRRADLYALGVVAYECLCGQRPFEAESARAMLACQVSKPPPPLDARAPWVPPGVVELVMGLLAKDREARLPDARALSRAIEALRGEIGRQASGAATLLTIESDETRSLSTFDEGVGAGSVDEPPRGGLRVGGVIVVLLLAAGLAWLALGEGGDRASGSLSADAVLDATVDAIADAAAAQPDELDASLDTGRDRVVDAVAAPLDAAPDARRRRVRRPRPPTRRPPPTPREAQPDVNALFILDAGS